MAGAEGAKGTGDPRTLAELTVDSRYNGPPDSANGGYISGLLAGRLGARGAAGVRVTLRKPPPLDTPMKVENTDDGGLQLLDGDERVAVAESAEAPVETVPPVPYAQAERAQARYRGLSGHPFPTCFTCGTDRAPGDGLRLFAGPVGDDDPTTVACTWTPDPALPLARAVHGSDDDTPRDAVPIEIVWAALDCPGGWSSDVSERPMVLGRMTAAVDRAPQVGRPHVVMGRLLGTEGRKVFTASTIYDPDGEIVARAQATWIMIRPDAAT
ncbi:hypothetical protein CDO52_13535 [Nocardiopsis gilva YIM 90087]|uniref:Thioesterase family protein n=2 Tax=Nocardiopsis gilva TaxID=280236 RepID=A0A223SDK0_9ACTN|nr:hypothetical protein [Nocardiopsis gilva]ASU86200.1 hypothetical protein CDO52_13535 [Nocardiopsis gilva YIM 90087]